MEGNSGGQKKHGRYSIYTLVFIVLASILFISAYTFILQKMHGDSILDNAVSQNSARTDAMQKGVSGFITREDFTDINSVEDMDTELYKSLQTRLNQGSSADYYPGARYCDIIGQSIFENSNSTFAARLSSISENLGIRKPICATSRDVLPAVDLIRRDNAMWLWNALESGKYVVRENGTLSTEYNSLSSINNAYNSSLFITRDELPDLKNYALGE